MKKPALLTFLNNYCFHQFKSKSCTYSSFSKHLKIFESGKYKYVFVSVKVGGKIKKSRKKTENFRKKKKNPEKIRKQTETKQNTLGDTQGAFPEKNTLPPIRVSDIAKDRKFNMVFENIWADGYPTNCEISLRQKIFLMKKS